jgi:transposase
MAQQRKPNDLSRSLIALDMDTTLIAVVELSLSNWLVAGIVPGVERQPLKRLKTDENALLALLNPWRDEAERSGHKISRIAVAFEAGRDGFWLARWLKARGIEAHVIHASSVAVSREHRRAKTDRLDTELLKRTFVGWLRGERDHCKTAGIPSLREEDAKRPSRERESLVGEQSRLVNRMKATLIRLRFLLFQKNSALAQWYRRRTEHAPKARKTMIVALARKLLIALWRLVREGVVPEGVVLRPVS